MAANIKDLGIDRMTVDDRLILLEEIRDSIASELENFEIPEWHLKMIRERLENDVGDPSQDISWKEFRKTLTREPSTP